MTTSTGSFWTRRWRGEAPWRIVFWRDMLAVGSAINLFSGFIALWLVSQEQPIAWALAVHFAPVPYNAFLVRSLWRAPGKPAWTTAGAAVWFAGMLVV